MIFRLSQKLNTKIKAGPLNAMPLGDNPYADWSCHLFSADRTQYVIVTNTKSLYSCVTYGKGITNDSVFIERTLSSLREFMEDDGQAFIYQKFIASASGTVRFAKTLNRSVTGSMNELVNYAKACLEEGELSPHALGFELNDVLLPALSTEKSRGYGKPNEAFKLLASAWCVYIVCCNDGSLYTGITTDLIRRCEQHNAGTASRYTRSRLPVELVYQEEQPSQSMALKRELEVKSLSRKAKESLIRAAG